MNNYFDFYKNMIDTQKTMMDGFKGTFPNLQTSFSQADVMKNYENWMKTQQNAFESYKKFFEGGKLFETNPLEAWKKAMDLVNPLELSKHLGLEESKVLEKVLDANKFYLSMYNFYEDLKDHYVAPAVGEYEKLVKESTVNFDNMFRESMLPLLPNELKPFIENPYSFSKTVVETTANFFAPWKETYPQMTELLMKAPLSRDNLVEYLKLWKENYNLTVGALMKSPVVGSSRELIEQQNRAVDAMVDMLLTTNEFIGKISSVTNLQGKLSIEDWLQEVKNSAEPKSFKEFYGFWTGKIEAELEKFFYTEEFGVLIGRTTDAAMRYKIESDKLVEKYLANSPIVTQGQIDSLYKTVYELKKQVKALKKELEETKEAKATPVVKK
ncbi:MAG: poly(R)-hydroxyalkanoic acid synthase subunit PhaE [Tissierellia bacterium]|nr:poly(R)-hydroxyalkanoic acid synthase subunit PhaE [Tissierellia bacterium]